MSADDEDSYTSTELQAVTALMTPVYADDAELVVDDESSSSEEDGSELPAMDWTGAARLVWTADGKTTIVKVREAYSFESVIMEEAKVPERGELVADEISAAGMLPLESSRSAPKHRLGHGTVLRNPGSDGLSLTATDDHLPKPRRLCCLLRDEDRVPTVKIVPKKKRPLLYESVEETADDCSVIASVANVIQMPLARVKSLTTAKPLAVVKLPRLKVVVKEKIVVWKILRLGYEPTRIHPQTEEQRLESQFKMWVAGGRRVDAKTKRKHLMFSNIYTRREWSTARVVLSTMSSMGRVLIGASDVLPQNVRFNLQKWDDIEGCFIESYQHIGRYTL